MPDPLFPSKPESTDQEFRRFVWGNTRDEGRPYTVLGDFYNDFGFPGVAAGSVMLGILGRLLLALLRGPPGQSGEQYRVALYALLATIFYVAVVTTYTVSVGLFIGLGLPFLVAIHVLVPVAGRLSAAPASPARGMPV